MVDEKIQVLLNEEKYEDAICQMKEKYVELFSNMLDKKNIDVPDNDDFYCFTSVIINAYPELYSRINFLKNGILSDDFSYLDEIELLKNTYEYLKVNY